MQMHCTKISVTITGAAAAASTKKNKIDVEGKQKIEMNALHNTHSHLCMKEKLSKSKEK